MAIRLLPAGRGLASPPRNSFPRCWVSVFPVLGLPHRVDSMLSAFTSPESVRALGNVDGSSIRGRHLDCSATHADAWNPFSDGIDMGSNGYNRRQNANFKLAIRTLQFAILFFLGSAPAYADGGSV